MIEANGSDPNEVAFTESQLSKEVPSSKDVVLLACPFCGGSVEVGHYHPDLGPSSCFVKCWCGARGTEHQYQHGDHKEAIAKAAASWNRRTVETSRDDAADAAKWRALRNCARITAMGGAGMSSDSQDAHVTLNFWTHNERERETYPREWLDTFVRKALAVGGAEEPLETTSTPIEEELQRVYKLATYWHDQAVHWEGEEKKRQAEIARLRDAAIQACSDMGCYCEGEHQTTPPEMRSSLCKLGDLVSSPEEPFGVRIAPEKPIIDGHPIGCMCHGCHYYRKHPQCKPVKAPVCTCDSPAAGPCPAHT